MEGLSFSDERWTLTGRRRSHSLVLQCCTLEEVRTDFKYLRGLGYRRIRVQYENLETQKARPRPR